MKKIGKKNIQYFKKKIVLVHYTPFAPNQLTYMAKKLMSFIVMVKQGIQINWVIMVFNNLYSKLQDLFTPTKPTMGKDNTEFNNPQVINILLQNGSLQTQCLQYQILRRKMKVLLGQHQKLKLHEAIEFRKHIFGMHPLIQMRRWKMWKKLVGRLPNQNPHGN